MYVFINDCNLIGAVAFLRFHGCMAKTRNRLLHVPSQLVCLHYSYRIAITPIPTITINLHFVLKVVRLTSTDLGDQIQLHAAKDAVGSVQSLTPYRICSNDYSISFPTLVRYTAVKCSYKFKP